MTRRPKAMEESEQMSSLDVRGLPSCPTHLRRTIREAVNSAFREHGVASHAVSITFVSDREMTELNRKALGRKGTTDVIAFDLSEKGLPYAKVGDVYISLDRARASGARFAVSCREEIIRLVVHGILHIIGYMDDTPARRRKMEACQETIVRNQVRTRIE